MREEHTAGADPQGQQSEILAVEPHHGDVLTLRRESALGALAVVRGVVAAALLLAASLRRHENLPLFGRR
ncbi:hypothetical protein GCM10010512_05100 [Streptomyces thermoviolaceus subsp. thermoviolaceus]|nr:hypothetical protein GCM10010499_12970 [Streptomyces thermoviolaceus subsp. apingens]GHA77424.1 hypothetical protein GCM10010512_05100 [Streptomyces thermoviolaceus subsp. thermoviolaceus]